MNENPFEDTYRDIDLIIPPRSITNGTAPVGVFLDYLNTVDMRKVRLCDAIQLLHWLDRYLAAMPEAVRKQYEKAMMKEMKE